MAVDLSAVQEAVRGVTKRFDRAYSRTNNWKGEKPWPSAKFTMLP